mgnify:CR=1 FL=1
MSLSVSAGYNGHPDGCRCYGRHVRIMLIRVYEHTVQAVIIEDTVVDTFRGGALFIDFPIGICGRIRCLRSL